AYTAVNARLCGALRSLGIPVELSMGESTPLVDARAGASCFVEPPEGELVVRCAKLAGSAVWWSRGGYLNHGSILLHHAQHELELFRVGRRAGADTSPAIASTGVVRSAQLSDWLPLASDARLRARVQAALDETWQPIGAQWAEFAMSTEEMRLRGEARALLV